MKVRIHGGLAWLALIIAVAIPALEMVGIYQVAQELGWGLTLLCLVAAGWAGVALIRAQPRELSARLGLALARGETPFAAIWSSGRRLLAGVLLILPGFGSDVLAILLLIWPSTSTPLRPTVSGSAPRGEGEVIEGEFRRED